MKLRTLHIQNFRALEDVTIEFDDFTCLVGANGVGKSCVFSALDLLFRKPASKDAAAGALEKDDFHDRDVSKPVQITATFDSLSPEAAADLKHYVRHDKLILTVEAVWDVETQRATIHQVATRLVMVPFTPYFAKEKQEGTRAPELRTLYTELRGLFPDLPEAKTKADMHQALRAYEEGRPDLCEERRSHDDFYGAAGSSGVLSRHLVWVHVPAVKDAADEQAESRGSWFSQLIQAVVRSKVNFDAKLQTIRTTATAAYREVVAAQQEQLAQISESLTSRMKEWSHPDATLRVKWSDDDGAAITIAAPTAKLDAADGNFDGPLARHGHGFQRSYLVALLQELLEPTAAGGPSLLLGIEEPELYQHPPQARHLAHVLEEFSAKQGQVVVCTHSPYFVSGQGFPAVRLVRRDFAGGTRRTAISQASLSAVGDLLKGAGRTGSKSVEGTRIKLHQQLHPAANELFFTPVAVLVEGGEDLAYITTHLHLSGLAEDFRKLGCHIVPADCKSNLPFLLAVARSLGIPAFTVFDSDVDLCEEPAGADDKKKQQVKSIRGLHEMDNTVLLKLCGHPKEPTFPAGDVWKPNMVTWRRNLKAVFEAELGDAIVTAAREAVRKNEGLAEGGLDKSVLFVGTVVEELWKQGHKSTTLERLCRQILDFARAAGGRPLAAATPPKGSA